MLKVYGRANSINVRKVLWMLDEVGVKYEREDWGRGFKSTDDPVFRKINPVGVVPVIDDGDFRLRESNTIVRYLAEKHGRADLYPKDLKARATTESWMDWASTDFANGMRPVFHALVVKNPAFADKVESGAAEWAKQMERARAAPDGQGPLCHGPELHDRRHTGRAGRQSLVLDRFQEARVQGGLGLLRSARRAARLQGPRPQRHALRASAHPGMAAFQAQICNGAKEETEPAMGRIAHPIGAVLAVLTCLQVGQAEAQEYCVSCSEPNALYRCVIEGAQPRGGQSLQMLCVTTMAKDGGHATCGVKRGTVFECDGAVKRVPWAALNVPAAARSGRASAPSYGNCTQTRTARQPRARRGSRCDTRARGPAANGARACQTHQREDGRADEEGGRHRQRRHQENLGLHAVAVHPLLSGCGAQCRASHSRAWRWASAISVLDISRAISMR